LMEMTDKSLLCAHCRGDKEAFGELVRRYGPALLGYLMKLCGKKEDAEDLFQETFRRVHEKAHTLQGNFKPWLFSIATNLALSSLRKRKGPLTVSLGKDCAGNPGLELVAVTAVDNDDGPLEQVIIAERKQQVRQAVASLPVSQRVTLILAYYQKLSYRQVAQILGCSIGTVKTHMHRALQTLAKKLPDISGEVE